MAKKVSPGTSVLGVRKVASWPATVDFPAPGGPVTTTNSLIAALSWILLVGVHRMTYLFDLLARYVADGSVPGVVALVARGGEVEGGAVGSDTPRATPL